MATKGDLRVYWIPQVPMKSYTKDVANIVEARLLLDTLAEYDLFQYHNRVKQDYANIGGVEIFNGDDWVDFHIDDLGKEANEWIYKNIDNTVYDLDSMNLDEIRSLYSFMNSIKDT